MVALDAGHRLRLGALDSPRGPGPAGGGLRLMVGVALLGLLIELFYIALASPRLAVRQVVVRGDPSVARLVAGRIRLPANTSMLRAPLGLVRKQAESVPAVKQAQAARLLPRGIVVTVERREPIAVIRRAEEAILLDAEGVAFSVPHEWGWGLPELVARNLGSGDVRRAEARAEIEALLGVLRALGPDPRLRATRLQLARDQRIEVTLDSGAKVNLGEGRELEAKARLLAAAIEEVGAERIARLDLADPASAYWEPRGAKGAAR